MEKLIELLRFLLLVNGLAYIITRSVILQPIRLFIGGWHIFTAGLIYCPPCMSFWLGLVLGLMGFWPWQPLLHTFWQGGVVACGAAAALSTFWGEESHIVNEINRLGYLDGSQEKG